MRAREPVAELSRGFNRRRTVEGHQRRRHTRDSDDVGPPPILRDIGDLDEIGASCDGFFKAMHGGGHSVRCGVGAEGIVRVAARRSSEASDESVRTAEIPPVFRRCRPKKNFGWQFVHRKFTSHPQVFHSLTSFDVHTTLETSCCTAAR